MNRSTRESPSNLYILFFIGIAFFLALALKNSGLYPFIFSDEYTYSRYSRLIPLSDSMIPGYLYLAVYRLTNHCAADFLGCAKIFNAFFFACATPFLYLVARRVMNTVPALLITVCALLAPINSYTTNYMPEAFYFLGFWVFMWSIFRVRPGFAQDWAIAGFTLGCTALIKPHSMLFVPAVLIYIGYVSATARDSSLRMTLRNLGAFLLAALVAKFAISFLIAGPAGVTFFGPSYSKIASSTTSGMDRIIQLLTLGLESVRGHLLALCLIVGLPMAVVIHAVCKAVFARREPDTAQKMAILATLLFANLIAVVGLFTASVVNTSVYESVTRLHMRYYDFIFPLTWIVVASRLYAAPEGQARGWRAVLAVLIGLPMVYAIYTAMAPFEPSIIDSPELRGFLFHTGSFYFMSALAVLSLGAWVYQTRWGARFFVYLALPLTILLTSYWVTREQRLHLIPDTFDRAGLFTRQYLSAEERTQVLIMGADLGGLIKASFYLDNTEVSPAPVDESNHYDFKGLPENKKWLLSIGSYVPQANGRPQVIMPGFTLTRISANEIIDLRNAQWPGVITQAQGLATPESWGSWSTDDEVVLTFARQLPETFDVRLTAHAFGPNIGKDFILRVGSTRVPFTLSEQDQELLLHLDNPERASSLIIEVPQAVSPAQLGMNGDNRKLGLGIQTLSIEQRD